MKKKGLILKNSVDREGFDLKTSFQKCRVREELGKILETDLISQFIVNCSEKKASTIGRINIWRNSKSESSKREEKLIKLM